MKQIPLYTGGGVSLSPVMAEGRTLSRYVRLVAEDGQAITDGQTVTTCVDTMTPEGWADCEVSAVEEVTTEQALSELLEVLA